MSPSGQPSRRIRTTLLELVGAVRDTGANEREVIATVADWLEHGAPRSCAAASIPVVPQRRHRSASR
jgi:hypothetical protein